MRPAIWSNKPLNARYRGDGAKDMIGIFAKRKLRSCPLSRVGDTNEIPLRAISIMSPRHPRWRAPSRRGMIQLGPVSRAATARGRFS